MTLDQAAELMGVTSRHTRRILAAYRERGAAALAHGHRGRRPVNATPEALVVDVAYLARTRYAGVNHTHLAELLAEREGIHIGRTTLRRVLLDAGLSSPRRRRPPKHRVRRQRMPQEGMLIQPGDHQTALRRVDRGLRLGKAHRGTAGPPHPPRAHPGDERRQLPPQGQPAECCRASASVGPSGRRLASCQGRPRPRSRRDPPAPPARP